ncbi:unnamed protein product [Amoebophrya sp. A25]|nr:unnamed protein product [Amoebophrya sp. A25]|eukprot:GSA25T00027665001.1
MVQAERLSCFFHVRQPLRVTRSENCLRIDLCVHSKQNAEAEDKDYHHSKIWCVYHDECIVQLGRRS